MPLSFVWLFVTPWTAPCHNSLSFVTSQSLSKSMFTELVRLYNYLILSHSLLFPSIFPNTRVFPNELAPLHQVAKAFVLQHQSFQWMFMLISFRIDWFDLPAVQWTLKSLLQHHNSKASILQHWVFFIVQLSYSHMTTGKSQFCLYGPLSAKWCLFFLISCLCHSFPSKEQSSFNFMVTITIILEPKKIKYATASTFFPLYLS